MNRALQYARQIAYSSEETLLFTHRIALELQELDGVYVECGVAAGAQIIAMADAAPNKVIYAFDSFRGIPLPSNKDDQMPGVKMFTKEEQSKLPDPGKQVLESSGATVVSELDFLNHLKGSGVDYSLVKSVPGWFEHTTGLFGQFKVNIALLRLDGDLYNSTYVCLQNLYPRVVKGGYVIIDDWELPGSRKAVEYYFGDKMPNMKFVSNIAYFIK